MTFEINMFFFFVFDSSSPLFLVGVLSQLTGAIWGVRARAR